MNANQLLFRISKISTFESNSQHGETSIKNSGRCSEYQRYQLLRAIHNHISHLSYPKTVVPNIKDINFWEQFTTRQGWKRPRNSLFRISKISTFESNSQHYQLLPLYLQSCSEYQRYQLLRAIHNAAPIAIELTIVVPNIKDINFWEQFTTGPDCDWINYWLFRISKISTFESNSQLKTPAVR